MDGTQWATFAITVASLVIVIILASMRDRRSKLFILPVALILIHGIIYYGILAIYGVGPEFSFSHWSRWLRFQEYGTLFIILIGVLVDAIRVNNRSR